MIDYAKALNKEILMRCNEKRIKSIFIGGGTPTYFSLEAWNILKQAIDKLDKEDDMEFSLEANPGTVTEEKLELFKAMGVNRISIGLQAWQNNLLVILGRIHDVNEFLNIYNLIRKFDFKNINVDLMFGLPNQTMEDWKQTLKEITLLNPEHISCYGLILEEGTQFYQLYEQNKLNLPCEELEREMYAYTLKFLKEKGYKQYEISNFATKRKECRHNLVYWNLDEYIGCGVSAHSYSNGYRYSNTSDIKEYIDNLSKNVLKEDSRCKNSIKDDIEEFMFMGLRKIDGINVNEFKNRFNLDIDNVYKDVIEKYIKNGLLIRFEDKLFLSPRGIEISNSVMCDFILTDLQ